MVKKAGICQCLGKTYCTRVFWLRLLVVTSLLAVAAVIGHCSYDILRKSELKMANSQYDSLSTDVLENVQRGFSRSTGECSLMTGSYNARFPSESSWPNVNLGSYFTQLQTLSTLVEFTFMVVLRTSQVADWQNYAFPLWDSSPTIPPHRAQVSPTERGVWDFHPEKTPTVFLDDLSGNTTWGGQSRVMLVVAETLNPHLLGLNVHYNEITGAVAERTMQCASGLSPDAARTACTTVTFPLPLPVPNPIGDRCAELPDFWAL
jgi:hypothetical protein